MLSKVRNLGLLKHRPDLRGLRLFFIYFIIIFFIETPTRFKGIATLSARSRHQTQVPIETPTRFKGIATDDLLPSFNDLFPSLKHRPDLRGLRRK